VHSTRSPDFGRDPSASLIAERFSEQSSELGVDIRNRRLTSNTN
jgi:hypothetical protein